MSTVEQQIIDRGIFIPGNVPSSKNSKEIGFFYLKSGSPQASAATVFHLKRGQDPTVITNYRPVRLNLNHSAATVRYIKDQSPVYIMNRQKFRDLLAGYSQPYRICFKFFRGTKHKFDYINAAQIVQDQMVEHGWLDDDDCVNMKPYFLDYEVDKDNPGVLISVF